MKNIITHRKRLDLAISLMDDKMFEKWQKKVVTAENRAKRQRAFKIKEAEANGRAFRTSRQTTDW